METPEKRRAAGKADEGLLSMRSFHEGGQVIIEIVDDGAGIDPERLKEKAVEKGLITADAAARMGEREAINLIFAAGFSTAEKVTNVSGRGVGMDVVKTNVEKIGGTVDVTSKVGVGTTLKIKIPLTAGHHPGPNHHHRRGPILHPPGEPAGAGPRRPRGHRADQRHARPPAAGQPAAAGVPEPPARPGRAAGDH